MKSVKQLKTSSLSNKDASKKYGVPPITISTGIKIKRSISKFWKTTVAAKDKN